ncbi:MAG: protein kinase [Myxococcales bacterium]|nr:protein kinase [Myxococcales bacterium]
MAQTPQLADSVRIGQVFLGKYRVESIIGQGGMGVVAEVTHLQLNQRLAIKMLRQDVLLDQDAVERFKREAQAAARLKSEYVAKVSDVGELEDGTPYMVMEYLEGHDLGALLDERTTLPVSWTCDLMLQTAEALAEAHSAGIVHRDIKPTNLFVTWRPDGTALIKVLDFGISKTTLGTDMHLTQTQSLLGTPAYMSPEQMRSARLVDARTDIWSLGSVMYELLEGRQPFEAESFSEMCVKVAVDAPAPMTLTPPDVQAVVLRCLAKAPEQRYQTMAEFARDLVPFVQDAHQASLLVERMQRMLRRSESGWESGGTNGGQRGSVPNHIRDVGSAPVRSAWHGGSEPAGAALRTPLPMSAVPRPTMVEPSAPALAPSQMFPAPKRTRRYLGIALLFAAVAGGAGVAIALTMGGSEDAKPSQATQQRQPTSTDGTKNSAGVTTPATIETPPTLGETPPTKGEAPPTKGEILGETPPAKGETTVVKGETPTGESTPTKGETVPAISSTGTKSGKGPKGGKRSGAGAKSTGAGQGSQTTQNGGTAGSPGSLKTVGKEPPKEVPKEPPKGDSNCDVYSHPHGCPK